MVQIAKKFIEDKINDINFLNDQQWRSRTIRLCPLGADILAPSRRGRLGVGTSRCQGLIGATL